jgi:methylenetetrahydrofolate dehydrogenase (NADP+)/methenyltetrahydrofolate cyclohydrolase
MTTNQKIIDGKRIALSIREEVLLQTKELNSFGISPGLAVIQVGDNPSSTIYIANKIKAAQAANIESFVFKLDESTTTKQLKVKIEHLNNRPKINGILVQLPLPPHIDTNEIINSISPVKDVDGLTIENVGKLVTNQPGLVPCTPQGCLILIKSIEPVIKGLNAVVIGRSNIVGRPMSNVLINEDCTVTVVHSQTQHIETICKQADILVVAAGKPNLVNENWVKDGAIIIDVGINKTLSPSGTTKLIGDVNFDSVLNKVRAITPVPGGVGPMTIACLLKNTIKASLIQHNMVINDSSKITKKDKFKNL